MQKTESQDDWLANLCALQPGESLTDAIMRAQVLGLNATLRTARKSRFYRDRLPESVRSLADLSALPFTFPSDLALWGDLLCVSQSEVTRMVSLFTHDTSGTTGAPKRLAFTAADLDRTRDFFRVGMARIVRPGDRVAVLLPGMNRPGGVADLLQQALPQAVVRGMTPEQARLERVQVLVLLPAQLQNSMETPAWPELHGVLTSGEVLDDLLRTKSRDWLPDGVFLDHYGLTETCFGGGVECPAHAGYHLRDAELIVEIVDKSGTPLPDGETGEVVITTLLREAMPLIRYRTGDVSRMIPGPCPCGSPVRRLARIRGRLVQGTAQVLRKQEASQAGCQ